MKRKKLRVGVSIDPELFLASCRLCAKLQTLWWIESLLDKFVIAINYELANECTIKLLLNINLISIFTGCSLPQLLLLLGFGFKEKTSFFEGKLAVWH